MPNKSARMEQIEALLVDDPNDAFLRYALAMEYASIGDDATAANKLVELVEQTSYVPGFLQAGQILGRLGRYPEAIAILKRGVEAARQQNDQHALGEMQGFLDSME